MEYSVGDFLDRYSIVLLKAEHFSEEMIQEVILFEKEFDRLCQYWSSTPIQELLDSLLKVNREIWSYESDLRKGKLGEYNIEGLQQLSNDQLLQLAAVGQAAINIRNVNRLRKKITNKIVELTKTGFVDIKVNHASEEVSNASGSS